MGLLNSDTQTVDAVLTKVGKRRLAEGTGLNIQTFALSDDYASYFLYNTKHVSGSAKYGEAIEGLPLPEATTSGAAMRYELTTRDRNVVYNPIISIPGHDGANVVKRIEGHGSEYATTITPSEINGPGDMFVFSFADITGLTITGATQKILSPDVKGKVPRALGIPVPAEFHGKSITVHADPSNKAFETNVEITTKNTGAAAKSLRILADANIFKEPTDKITT